MKKALGINSINFNIPINIHSVWMEIIKFLKQQQKEYEYNFNQKLFDSLIQGNIPIFFEQTVRSIN